MNTDTEFDCLAAAYSSRYVLRTDADYRRVLGVSFETIKDNCDSEHYMDMYYNRLSEYCRANGCSNLHSEMTDYIEASKLYTSLDWGDRDHAVPRRMFCRMLFRLYATVGRELSAEELAKFKVKEADERLLTEFFPDGIDEEPAVSIELIVLMAFGVVKPWEPAVHRRDITDTQALTAMHRMHELLVLLEEDMPRVGSTKKPLAFYDYQKRLATFIDDTDLSEYSPMMMNLYLWDTAHVCRDISVPSLRQKNFQSFISLHMPGIWVDDADKGRTRFWIFPENHKFAFCYSTDGCTWTLRPYDLLFRDRPSKEIDPTFQLITPEANLSYIFSPDKPIPEEAIARGSFDSECDEETGDFVLFEFFNDCQPFPEWFEWRSWQRLSATDPRHAHFREILRELYDPDSPQSLLLTNVAAKTTDLSVSLIGRDNKYLYLYDWRHPRYIMRETKPEYFLYQGTSKESPLTRALFELDLSEEHPLYALPRRPVHPVGSPSDALSAERSAKVLPEVKFLIGVLEDSENITEAYICGSGNDKRLIIPAYGVSIELNMDILAPIGVRRFTRTLGE